MADGFSITITPQQHTKQLSSKASKLLQQAWSSIIKMDHQLLLNNHRSIVVMQIILVIKAQLSANARKRKEDEIFSSGQCKSSFLSPLSTTN